MAAVAAVTAGVAVVAVVAAERSVVYGGDRYDGKGNESHMRIRDGGVCDNGRTKEEEEGKRTENREQRKDVHSGTPALTVLDLSDPNQERLNGLPLIPPRTRPKRVLQVRYLFEDFPHSPCQWGWVQGT